MLSCFTRSDPLVFIDVDSGIHHAVDSRVHTERDNEKFIFDWEMTARHQSSLLSMKWGVVGRMLARIDEPGCLGWTRSRSTCAENVYVFSECLLEQRG